MRKHVFGFALIAILAVPTVLAQGAGPGPDRRPFQRGLPMNRLHMMAREMTDRLDLTEQQQDQLQSLVDKHQKLLIEQRSQMRKVRELQRELRAAEREGDTTRAGEIRAKLDEVSGNAPFEAPGRGPRGEPFAAFFDEFEATLTDDQVGKLVSLRQNWQDRAQLGEQIAELLDALPKELDLDQQQLTTYESLRQDLRDQFAAQRRRSAGNRDLMEQLREARDAGDTQRAADLMEKIRETRPDPQRLIGEFLDDLAGTLTDDQKATLAGVRETLLERGHRGALDVRGVLGAARRLRLTREQEDQLRDIEQSMGSRARSAPRDRAAMSQLAGEAKQMVLQILSDEQKQQFEEMLTRAERGRGLRDRRPPPGERGDRERDRIRNRDRDGVDSDPLFEEDDIP